MIKNLFIILMTFLFLACSNKTMNEPNKQLSTQGAASKPSEDLNASAPTLLLDKLKQSKQDEAKALKLANELIAKFPDSDEAEEAIAYKEETRERYKNLAKAHENRLSIRHGKKSTWYYNKTNMFELAKLPFFLYITKNKDDLVLMMKIQTIENKSGSILSYSIITDENEYELRDGKKNERRLKNGVWISLDRRVLEHEYASIKDMALSKNSRIKFSRRSGFYSYTLNSKAKQAIINVFNAFIAMKKYEDFQ